MQLPAFSSVELAVPLALCVSVFVTVGCACVQLPAFSSVEVAVPLAPQIQQGRLTVTLAALTQVGRQEVTRTMLVEVSTAAAGYGQASPVAGHSCHATW